MSKLTLRDLEKGALFQFVSNDPIETTDDEITHPDNSTFQFIGTASFGAEVIIINKDTGITHTVKFDTENRKVILMPNDKAKR